MGGRQKGGEGVLLSQSEGGDFMLTRDMQEGQESHQQCQEGVWSQDLTSATISAEMVTPQACVPSPLLSNCH